MSEPSIVGPAESIVLLPPGAGLVLGVTETRYTNAQEQLISLTTRARTPAQNYIRVQRFTGVAHSARPGALQDVPLGNLDMAGEARGTVNFADMRQSPFFVQNSYGPFGYSMGRTATADLCMYAWQRIEEVLSPGGSVQRGAINIRLQYCDQTATEADLLAIMLQLRIRGVGGRVVGSPAAIGALGVTISPAGSAFPGNVLAAPVAPVRSSAPAASAPAPTPAAPPTPVPGSPVVPAPGGSTTGPTVPPPSGGTMPVVPAPSGSTGTTAPSGPVVPAPSVRLENFAPAPGRSIQT